MNTKLIWATPQIDTHIAMIARVSNPANQDSAEIKGLLTYMMQHGHVSPFEMASACIEITTTRDIGRQILRHRSFSFSEFSGRYSGYDALPDAPLRECRMQDSKNRQNSLTTDDAALAAWWREAQIDVEEAASGLYREALARGIAKEQARALLPEGLTTSRIYMAGTLRSWLHYLKQRLDPSTQKEHRAIAAEILALLRIEAPVVMEAFFP